MSSIIRYSVLAAFTPILLAACGSSTPNEAAFFKNASAQLEQTKSEQVCLPLYLSSDVSFGDGSLYAGGVVFGVDAPIGNYPGYYAAESRQTTLQKLDALVGAGVVEKKAYEIYRNGVLAPGFKYSLTELGRKSLEKSTSSGTSCLSVGKWIPTKLVKPRSAVEGKEAPDTITKKESPEGTTYEASVSFELKESPEWANSPAVQAAFSNVLTELKQGKQIKVELLKFNEEWVSKANLARKMGDPMSRTDGSTPSVLPIPKDLETVAFSKLSAYVSSPYSRTSAQLQLLESASETPSSYSHANPGTYIFTETPDPGLSNRLQTQQETARMKQILSTPGLSAEQKLSLEANLVRAEAVKATTATSDAYLNRRKALLETLDSLVLAGAFVKSSVKPGEIPGLDVPATRYNPAPGVVVRQNAVQLGTPSFKGPLEQKPIGRTLMVTGTYTLENVPQWVTKAAETNPAIRAKLSGGKFTAVIVGLTEATDFPYRVETVSLN